VAEVHLDQTITDRTSSIHGLIRCFSIAICLILIRDKVLHPKFIFWCVICELLLFHRPCRDSNGNKF
jgi:hypothetical protein